MSTQKTSIKLFIAALFIITSPRDWKPLRGLIIDEWLNTLWYVHIREYYSATNRNKVLKYTTAWVDLQGITLRDMTLISEGHILYNSMYITFSR